MNKNVNIFSLRNVCIIIVITAIVSGLTTGIIIYSNSKIILGTSAIKQDENLKEFLRIYNGLDDNYYENINKTEMIEAAIAAMMDYLGEDYSTYMNKDETENLADHLSGKYSGIGVSIYENNVIYKVYKDTPADKAGLMKDDILLNINNKDTEGLNQSEVANLINKNGKNTITVSRNEKKLTFEVKAENINEPLNSEIIPETSIGYIELPAFTNTVEEEFKKSLDELHEIGISSLIIDLRNNSGGYLKGASEIASMFLEKGKRIYSLEGKENTEHFHDETNEHQNIPVVILVNEASASASEVLTAALKESYGATIIGKKTFGKGKVQQTKSLEDGSMIKYTTAKWLTPNGNCIDEIGIEPDIDIDLTQNEEGKWIDTQFDEAVNFLLKDNV